MKPTQKQRIIGVLKERGEISRNQCLKNFISRLGAYIIVLKKEGWDFDHIDAGNDYIYRVTKSPYIKVKYSLPDGREIITTELVK